LILLFLVTFSCLLKFIVKDCDPATGEIESEGYEDEYQVILPLLFIIYINDCFWKFY